MSLVNSNSVNSTTLNGGDELTDSSTWPGGNVIVLRQAVGIKSTLSNAIILRQTVSFVSTSDEADAIIIRQNVARRSTITNAVILRQRITNA